MNGQLQLNQGRWRQTLLSMTIDTMYYIPGRPQKAIIFSWSHFEGYVRREASRREKLLKGGRFGGRREARLITFPLWVDSFKYITL